MSASDGETRVHAVRLECPDGLGMALDVHRPAGALGPVPVVVLCHGFKGFRLWGMFPHLARRIAAGGRACALFDFSHNGTDQGLGTEQDPREFTRLDLFERQTIGRQVEDLGRILDAVTGPPLVEECHLDPEQVFVVGHSMGGGVAILRAAEDARVRGVVALNAVSTFQRFPAEALAQVERDGRVLIPNARTGQQMPLGRAWFEDAAGRDLLEVARRVQAPALVLQGAEDPNVRPEEGEALARALPHADLQLVPGGDHTFGARHPWAGWTPALEEVARQLGRFLPSVGRPGPRDRPASDP